MTELKKSTVLAWRKHLASEAGIEGMLFLRERIPAVKVGEQHEIIFGAGKVEGYKDAIDTISELLVLEQTKDIKADND